MSDTATTVEWQQTACILCECNCGIEVRLGGDDGRRFERIRGDKAHPASQGYTCEKALRLDHYQNGAGAGLIRAAAAPARRHASRRSTGTPRSPRWPRGSARCGTPTAATTIFYYGGGGQGNHLGGAYGRATLRRLGGRYRSNALAQEKTGEFWVNGQDARRAYVRGDFEHCEVALFVGKNPWQSATASRGPAPRSRRSPATRRGR